jgi:hypothetical protein
MGKTCLFFLPDEALFGKLAFFFLSWDGGAPEAGAMVERFLQLAMSICARHGSDVISLDPSKKPTRGAKFAAPPSVLALCTALMEIEFAGPIDAGQLELHAAAIPTALLDDARRRAAAHHPGKRGMPLV